MSDVETALTGAEVAPVENAETPQNAQENAPESTTEQVEEQDGKPRDDKGRFVPQERLNEVTRHRREAERRAESLERELSQYRQATAQSQPQSNEKPPALGDYGYDQDAWAQAMTQYAIAQAESRVEQRFQQQSQRQYEQTVEQQFEARSQKYAADHPDFDNSVADLSRNVQFHPALVEAIGTSEHGPAIVHYLAQHLDEADRISRLPPHIAAVQLGRIEAQVSTPRAKPVTNAPNPLPTLGGGKATVTKNPDEMSQAEWLAWRNTSLKR